MSLEYFNKEWNGGDKRRLTAARLAFEAVLMQQLK